MASALGSLMILKITFLAPTSECIAGLRLEFFELLNYVNNNGHVKALNKLYEELFHWQSVLKIQNWTKWTVYCPKKATCHHLLKPWAFSAKQRVTTCFD